MKKNQIRKGQLVRIVRTGDDLNGATGVVVMILPNKQYPDWTTKGALIFLDEEPPVFWSGLCHGRIIPALAKNMEEIAS